MQGAAMKHRQGGRIALAIIGAALLIGGGFPSPARANDIVLLQGFNLDEAAGLGAATRSLTRAVLCTPEGRLAVAGAINAIRERIHAVSPYSAADAAPGLQKTFDTYEELCKTPEPFSLEVFTIAYATCGMTMQGSTMTLDLRFPPGQPDGVMTITDHETRKAIVDPIVVTRVLGDAGNGAGVGGINLSTVKASSATGEHLGYRTRAYDFDFEFRINPFPTPSGEGDAAASRSIGLPAILTTGTAWITRDAPGIDIVRAFYETFAAAVQSGQGGSALLGGLYNHMLLQEGLPLEIDQFTRVTMGGMTVQRDRSRTEITNVRLLPMADDYCSRSEIPEGYTTSSSMPGATSGQVDADAAPDLSAAMQQVGAGFGALIGAALSGQTPAGAAAAPGGASSTPPAAGGAAAAEIGNALGNLSAEDRAAMQQAGAGFGALIGAALSGQLPGAGVAATTPGRAAAAPARAGRPSSAELYSDNLTQMVQRHLEVLGYEPGNTDGELSVQTAIAISQFQAEKGLQVTGEVTPQLAGILSAEVDR